MKAGKMTAVRNCQLLIFCSKGHPKPRDHGKNIIQGQLEGNIQGGVAPQL
jgi:hypothetical protein